MHAKTSLFLCLITLIFVADLHAKPTKHNGSLVPPTETTTMSSIKQLEDELEGLQNERFNQTDDWYGNNGWKIRATVACICFCPAAVSAAMNIKTGDPSYRLVGACIGSCAGYAFGTWHEKCCGPNLSNINNQIKETTDKLAELKKQKVE